MGDTLLREEEQVGKRGVKRVEVGEACGAVRPCWRARRELCDDGMEVGEQRVGATKEVVRVAKEL